MKNSTKKRCCWKGYYDVYYPITGFYEPVNESEDVSIYVGKRNEIICELTNDFNAHNMTTDELWEWLKFNLYEIKKVDYLDYLNSIINNQVSSDMLYSYKDWCNLLGD